MSIPWRRSGLRRATEGQREKDHLQDEQRGADPVEQAESSGSGLGGRAHRLDRGGDGEGGYRRAEPCEQWSDGTPRAAERNRADHRKGGQRQRRRVQAGEHGTDEVRRQLPAWVLARQRRDVAREHDLRGHGGEEQLRPEQGSTGKPIEEPRHPGVLRYVRPCMQGDMDIVDPLIDDYLTRLAGSPDPVEAEMRRYADERDGYPIVGQTLGTLLAQYALLMRARRIFEVGSGFGYSAFWFARVLEPASTVTLTDFDRENLDRARAWLGKAGLLERCRFEPAGDGLEALARCEAGLDIVFLDGEKAEYPKALAIALPKLRAGGLVLADSVLWGGAVARGESDAATAGLREYTRLIFGSEGLVSTIVPIRDGLAITWKR
ncbi:MAG: O-methyltransferase [Deltaproteobacteria bacterium]|nr:MAG: O-methyltransferase [Deltaproteobacteria bacterium]